jgi:hypothetical protein
VSYLPLNNVTTSDDYRDDATAIGPGSGRVTLDIGNAAVYLQLGDSVPDVRWRPELFVTPGFKSYDRRCDAARVRSAALGHAAQVTLELVPAAEVTGA